MEDCKSAATDVNAGGRGSGAAAVPVAGVTVVSKGRLFQTGEIFDEYWLQHQQLPSPELIIAELKSLKGRPDIFTFAQRVPEVSPRYAYYHEPDNYAVLPVSTYDEWLEKRISATTRRNIRLSAKRGIEIREAAYDDDYVKGIMSIYNESPIRAGRRFRHFGKSFDKVKAENGTYAERSTFLAALRGEEMVGYLKIVWDAHTAAIMQILSKISVRDSRPNNALMAEAVKLCCARKVGHLLYEKYDYGNKVGDSLTKFKENHGFARVDVPRYYVPLTTRGALALRLGLHRKLVERVPEWVAAPLRDMRTKWHERRAQHSLGSALSTTHT
jgi:hypothetical protein